MSEAADAAPAVSLVVVNHQGAEQVVACLASLLEAPGVPVEVFAVDNASDDGSLEAMRAFAARHPEVEVVASPTNLGYAGALNLVLDRCAGRYVGLFNMDIVAEPGWLAPLVEHLDASPNVAAVNPMLLLDDGARVNATGLDLHVTGLAFNRGLGRPRDEMPGAPFDVEGAQGAAVVCRREVLLRLGGLDERGFLYHEDVRLSWALRSMGFAMACVPTSVVRHEYHLSMHAEKLYLLERNRWWLLATALGPASLLRIAPLLALTELMLLGYALLRGPRFVAAKLRAMRDALRGRAETREARAAWQARSTVGERALLRGLGRGYAWSQFATLAGERGAPRRPFEAPRPDAR
ncbi:MAG: glycosyltransferase family 2 protein [Actinomycetota bacterium]|nr:glycosyltransferase family 2 protein [Actinomycetota bacterium]